MRTGYREHPAPKAQAWESARKKNPSIKLTIAHHDYHLTVGESYDLANQLIASAKKVETNA